MFPKESNTRRWMVIAIALVAIAAAAPTLPGEANPLAPGFWDGSENPLFTCEVAGEDGLVCAEWITGAEDPLYEPCCIHEDDLGSTNLWACPNPQSASRPSDF